MKKNRLVFITFLLLIASSVFAGEYENLLNKYEQLEKPIRIEEMNDFKKVLPEVKSGQLNSIIIPDGVTSIEDSTFSNKKFKTSAKKKSISWVDYFFMDDTDIDILGLNLCSDEIDLWWILNYRASIFEKLKNNHVHFYDLEIKNQHKNDKYYSDRLILLKSMKVEVEFIEKAEEYDSDFYSLCLKKIKELQQNSSKEHLK